MKYVLTFRPDNCDYRAHAADCQAAKPNKSQGVLGQFNTLAQCEEFANADESEKAGEPTKARYAACKCTKL